MCSGCAGSAAHIPPAVAAGRSSFVAVHLIDRALLRFDERRQFGQQHLADREQIALALQHAGELRQVCLQPVLLLVASPSCPRRLSIIVLMLSFSSATSPRVST